jgi:hypothetical protein
VATAGPADLDLDLDLDDDVEGATDDADRTS